jgi:hypothetical protein
MPDPRPLAAALLLGLLASAAPARADSDPAETLFQQGIKEMAAGRYETACPPIEQSYRIDPRLGALFALAECESKRGRIATAVARYEEYLAAHAGLSPDKKAKQADRALVARRQVDVLRPDLPKLTLVLPREAPRDTVVRCDGAPVSDAALGAPIPLDPGEHVITTAAHGGALSEVRLKLARGQQMRLVLTVMAAPAAPALAAVPSEGAVAPPPATVAPADAHPSSGRRVGAYVAGGVGLVGLTLGGVLGGLALSRKSTVDANCAPTADPGTLGCHGDGYQASRELQQFGLWSTVGFAVGAAGGVLAVVLIATEPAKPKNDAVTGTLRRHEAATTTATLGLVSAGPGAAMMRIEGAW